MLQPDHLITLGLFWPLRKLGFGSRQPRLPILMYHRVSPEGDNSRWAYYNNNTRPEVFGLHLKTLKNLGYDGLDVETAWNRFKANPTACGKLVAITFDDGYRDFYTHALPALEAQGYAATVFLPTAFIGDARRCFAPRNAPSAKRIAPWCMTWPEVQDARTRGIRFGAHTVHHPQLYTLEWPEIRSELNDSRWQIAERLGTDISCMAYPYAFPDHDPGFVCRLRHLLPDCGYNLCVTTRSAVVLARTDPLLLPRVHLSSAASARLLRAYLEGASSWLAAAQRLLKRARRRARRPAAPPACTSPGGSGLCRE